jgi:hypothetical protein
MSVPKISLISQFISKPLDRKVLMMKAMVPKMGLRAKLRSHKEKLPRTESITELNTI